MGWQAFLEGAPAIGWAETQQRYFDFIKSKRTGKRWLSAVIRKCWDIAWDQWDHRNKVLNDKDHSILTIRTDLEIKDQVQLGIRTITDAAKPSF